MRTAELPWPTFGRHSHPTRVGRTTILNLVDRLQHRGWLVRRDREKPCHYLAALGRDETAVLLAGGFVDDFFAGSTANLVMSLLGSKRLKPGELERLRQALDSTSKQSRQQKGK